MGPWDELCIVDTSSLSGARPERPVPPMRPAPTLDGPTKPPVISQSGRGRAGVQTCRVVSVECECERARAWGGEILCTPSASVFPENMVQSVRKGASPEKFAGPPPASGGRIFPRPLGVVAERNHRTWPSLAYKFRYRQIPSMLKLLQHAHPYNRFANFC